MKRPYLVLLACAAAAACSPTDSEQALRNQSAGGAGSPPDNVLTQGNVAEASSAEIANTSEESTRRSRAGALGAPQERAEGETMGPAATDTSGRAHQEKPEGE